MNSNISLKILLKNSFFILLFLFFLSGCINLRLNNTLKEVSKIDSKYNVKLSDYENGLVFFDTHMREINENQTLINNSGFDYIIGKLESLKSNKSDEDSINYINFRIKLFQAEKFYKLAERKPFTNYKTAIICNKKDEILNSLHNAQKAIDYSNDAIKIYENINFKKKIDISENWVITMQASNKELSLFIKSRINAFNQFCNQSLSE